MSMSTEQEVIDSILSSTLPRLSQDLTKMHPTWSTVERHAPSCPDSGCDRSPFKYPKTVAEVLEWHTPDLRSRKGWTEEENSRHNQYLQDLYRYQLITGNTRCPLHLSELISEQGWYGGRLISPFPSQRCGVLTDKKAQTVCQTLVRPEGSAFTSADGVSRCSSYHALKEDTNAALRGRERNQSLRRNDTVRIREARATARTSSHRQYTQPTED